MTPGTAPGHRDAVISATSLAVPFVIIIPYWAFAPQHRRSQVLLGHGAAEGAGGTAVVLVAGRYLLASAVPPGRERRSAELFTLTVLWVVSLDRRLTNPARWAVDGVRCPFWQDGGW